MFNRVGLDAQIASAHPSYPFEARIGSLAWGLGMPGRHRRLPCLTICLLRRVALSSQNKCPSDSSHVLCACCRLLVLGRPPPHLAQAYGLVLCVRTRPHDRHLLSACYVQVLQMMGNASPPLGSSRSGSNQGNTSGHSGQKKRKQFRERNDRVEGGGWCLLIGQGMSL